MCKKGVTLLSDLDKMILEVPVESLYGSIGKTHINTLTGKG